MDGDTDRQGMGELANIHTAKLKNEQIKQIAKQTEWQTYGYLNICSNRWNGKQTYWQFYGCPYRQNDKHMDNYTDIQTAGMTDR